MSPFRRDCDFENTSTYSKSGLSATSVANVTIIGTLVGIMLMVVFFKVACLGQKTRNPQRRRMYRAGAVDQHSVSQPEPSIYVSPSNLPPPPKYEALAPPSYDEVVGTHYPNYPSIHVQPITQPITTALAQTSNATANEVPSNSDTTAPATLSETPVLPSVVTVTNERRPSLNA